MAHLIAETEFACLPPRLRLEWAGRDDRQVIFTTTAGSYTAVPREQVPAARLHEVERLGAGADLLIHGENYLAMRALLAEGRAGCAKLIYIDPPFNTGRQFEHYADGLDWSGYLGMLRDRLALLAELLADDGLLLVHLDDRAASYVRVLLDEILGPENFRNSLVIKRVHKNLQRQFKEVAALPRAHDIALLYSRRPETRFPLPLVAKPDGPAHPEGYWKDFWSTADRPTMRYELLGVHPVRGQWKWRRERAEQAVHNYLAYEREETGQPLVAYWQATGQRLEFIRSNSRGRVCHWVPPSDQKVVDSLWTEFSGYAFRHRFPTEKSESLLSRAVELFTAPGDLVLDCFGGSGTTGAAAAGLGRRWILIERGDQARSHIVPRLASVATGGFRICEVVTE